MIAPAFLLSLMAVAPTNAAVDVENPTSSVSVPVGKLGEAQVGLPARADSTPALPPERHRTTAIYLLAGLGLPVGFVGLEAVHRIGSLVEITAGYGRGLSASGSQPHAGFSHSVQWAVMPRLRWGDDHNALTLGAGASGGNYGDLPLCFDDPCSSTYPVSYFVWNNLEIGGEHWSSSGLAVRYFVGYAHGWCVSDACVSADDNLPYFGLGVGYAF
jgi:hypothetical protein